MSFSAAIAHRQREKEEKAMNEKLTKIEENRRKKLLKKQQEAMTPGLLDPDDLDQRLEASLRDDSKPVLFVSQKPHLSVVDASTTSTRQKLTIRNPKQVLGDAREAALLVHQVQEHQRAAEVAEAFKRDERERAEMLLREVRAPFPSLNCFLSSRPSSLIFHDTASCTARACHLSYACREEASEAAGAADH